MHEEDLLDISTELQHINMAHREPVAPRGNVVRAGDVQERYERSAVYHKTSKRSFIRLSLSETRGTVPR